MSGTTKDAEDVANEAAKAASAKSDEMPSIAVHCAMTLRGSAPRPRSCYWTGRPGINRQDHRDATMLLVAYRHGLRASEVCDCAGTRSISSGPSSCLRRANRRRQ